MTSVEVLAQRHPHGTRTRYVVGCRCDGCRAANTAYERTRAKARRKGDWNGLVDAGRVRAHLAELAAAGVGLHAVADISGVARSVLQLMKTGKRERLRARGERAILAVTAAAAMNDATLVPAGPLWARLNELLELGFTKRELARHLGYANGALQFKTDLVTARSSARVERVCDRLKGMLVRRLELRAELGALGRRDDEVETVLTDRLARRRENARDWARANRKASA